MRVLIPVIILIALLIISGLRWEQFTKLQKRFCGLMIVVNALILIICMSAVSGAKVEPGTLGYYLKSIFSFDPQHPLLFTEFYFWAFFLLVMISLLIAMPVAYYFMHDWLENYTYRADISSWIFASSGGAALMITLVTVSFQAIRAAVANPVKSLRME